MKTPMQELINDVCNMSQGLDVHELYNYFIKRSKELLEKEKQVIIDAHCEGCCSCGADGEFSEDYYNETFNK